MNFEKAFRQFQKKWRQGKYKSQVQKGCVGVGAVCAVVLIAYFMQARQDEQAIEVLRQIRNWETSRFWRNTRSCSCRIRI